MDERVIQKQIELDLEKKMVFLAGPRQVGKTTLAQNLVKKYNGEYYNWDEDSHKELIRKSNLNEDRNFWVFDEIHKFSRWRNWLKGKYDLNKDSKKILVTGSAKLDLYSRGGDSLQGRYYFHRLHPLTLAELESKKSKSRSIEEICEMDQKPSASSNKTLEQLLDLSGFPEPFFSGSKTELQRWSINYGYRLIREDIRNLENIQMIDKVQDLYDLLPTKVGSPLSINSLREDLEINFRTVDRWLNILEKNYSCFRIAPFGPPKVKAVKKEQKLYLWDWSRLDDNGAKLENLVALHLLRMCHWFLDTEGLEYELRYFRDTDKRKVDFIITHKKKPIMAVEVKNSEQNLDSNLKYLLERVKIPYAFQVHLNSTQYKRLEDINGAKVFMVPADRFLLNLI